MKLSCERCELEYAPHGGDGCPGCAFHPGDDPRHFGPYRLLGVAGRGALGIVFRARRDGHGSVALKILTHPDPRWIAPFEREGELTAKLSHPSIVRVRDRGRAESRPYIAFDYIAGRTLAEALREKKLGPYAKLIRAMRLPQRWRMQADFEARAASRADIGPLGFSPKDLLFRLAGRIG